MAKRKSFILHIGRHKTGTSNLQHYFWNNREIYRNSGILYPDPQEFSNRKPVAHHELSYCIKNKNLPRAKDIVDNSIAEAEKYCCETIIISSEDLQNLTEMSRIIDLFGGHELKTIVYIREIVDYITSSYAQYIHANNFFVDFQTYVRPFDKALGLFLQKWSAVSDKMYIRPFCRDSLVGGDVVQDFCSTLKLPFFENTLSGHDKENTSIGGNLLFVKLLINFTGGAENNLYFDFSRLAKDHPQFQRKLYVPSGLQEQLRNCGYNRAFANATGVEPTEFDFSKNSKLPDIERLKEDIQIILSNERIREATKDRRDFFSMLTKAWSGPDAI